MISLACSKETTWSSVDITSAFLNADIHEDDTVLITPPQILVKMVVSSPTLCGVLRKQSMVCEKPHVYGSKSVTTDFEI